LFGGAQVPTGTFTARGFFTMKMTILSDSQRPRLRRGVTAALLLVSLAGCGGGVYVEAEGPPPDISLAASSNYAVRGQALQLVAAVSASNGVASVDFYRIDFGQPVLLGSVYQPPAKWNTAVPVNAASSVAYYARVCDQAGYCTSSAVETVAVVN
jgi:hypothetical protein